MRPILDLAIARRVLTLGAPVIFAMLSQASINLVDTIFVGRLPRDVATAGQSALGISLPLFWMFGGACSALGVGTQAMVARRYGEGNREGAGAVLANSVLLAVLASAVVTIAGWLALPALFRLMHDDPSVRELGTTYARLRFVGIVSMVGTFSFKAFYDGTERTWVHLVVAIVMNLANILLAWLLVFGKLGFPRLEVAGAGIAAVIASFLGLLGMMAFTFRRGDRRDFRPYRASNISGRQLWAIAKLSLPSGAATLVVMTGFLMVLWVVGRIDELTPRAGSVHTAGSKIIMDIMSLCFIGCMGLGTATATLVSKSLGESKPELAERYGWEAMKVGAVVFGLLGVLEAVFPDAALGVFTADAAVIDAARSSMRLIGGLEFMVAIGLIATQCLFGAGNTRFVMFAELTLHFGALIPLSYVFGVLMDWGVLGVWIAAAVYIVGLTCTMVVKFAAGGWKTIKI
ncbi:MAG: MATE family efflux transporter [Deltaproteobacteria bacterium]|nr:MATE family efflux transporter [Deltaproteobacteria bacterium]